MLWHSVICRLFVSATLAALTCSGAHALEQERLWLPKSLQKHYLSLLRAAEAAEALPRCQEVLEGTIDREQSLPDHPIFRILCRQQSGRSYNEMVDGLNFKTLTTRWVPEHGLTEQEREQLRQQEQARVAAAASQRKAELWQQCLEEFELHTKFMIDMVLLTEHQPEPLIFNDELVQFQLDFNAKAMSGAALQFRADCSVAEDGQVEIRLAKR